MPKDLLDMTIREAIQTMRDMNAGMTQHIVRDSNDKPTAAVIVLDGEEADDLLDKINGLYNEGER